MLMITQVDNMNVIANEKLMICSCEGIRFVKRQSQTTSARRW